MNLFKACPVGRLGRSIANSKDRQIGQGWDKPLRQGCVDRGLARKGQGPSARQTLKSHRHYARLDQGLDHRFMAPLDQPLGGGGGLRLSTGDPDAQPLGLMFRQQQAISACRLD